MASLSLRPAGEHSPSSLTPEQIFAKVSARERDLSRLLIFYISGGLLFMLLPGTFLGVWNLISISGRRAADSISPAWIQAHGHAQVLGWIGSFILGIGYYSLPKLRRTKHSFPIASAWLCGGAWMTGVLLRWFANVYLWHWRFLLPVSAILELGAFLVFFNAVSRHSPSEQGGSKLDMWVLVVIAGTMGLLATLVLNLFGCLWTAYRGTTPAFTPAIDQRFLFLATWAFMPLFVWGFSAKWLPTFLGTGQPNTKLLGAAIAVEWSAVVLAVIGWLRPATLLLAAAAIIASGALHVFETATRPAKTKGVHASFPTFIRLAYAWLLIATALGIWASNSSEPAGIWGASRHALTVGFIATMVFCVGQRVLPAFSGMRLLFSPSLMFMGLVLLNVGCSLRVASEVLAYQEIARWAWHWLPVSAVIELSAVTLFAANLMLTFSKKPLSQAPLIGITSSCGAGVRTSP